MVCQNVGFLFDFVFNSDDILFLIFIFFSVLNFEDVRRKLNLPHLGNFVIILRLLNAFALNLPSVVQNLYLHFFEKINTFQAMAKDLTLDMPFWHFWPYSKNFSKLFF